eukprot:scaffold128_cov198-Alexandrium_tamarense.AAC.36
MCWYDVSRLTPTTKWTEESGFNSCHPALPFQVDIKTDGWHHGWHGLLAAASPSIAVIVPPQQATRTRESTVSTDAQRPWGARIPGSTFRV